MFCLIFGNGGGLTGQDSYLIVILLLLTYFTLFMEKKIILVFGLIVLLAVVAVVYLFAARRRGKGFFSEEDFPADEESPWEIVDKQYARGEIDREELERRRSLLRGETGESEEGGDR